MPEQDRDDAVAETTVDQREGNRLAANAEDGKAKLQASRSSSLDKARMKLRSGWRNDAGMLNQYFQSCVSSWKIYKGERNPKQVMKLQVIYRQATQGDCTAPPPANLKSIGGLKWQAWMALKGMPVEMAKRRFITYLAEINPLLIDVLPDEQPPDGFCKDSAGNTICAKCNTVSGCGRPLLDQFKVDLRDQLFDDSDLQEPQALRKWIKNCMDNQRCVWGVHKAVPAIDIKPFRAWFDKDENGGYQPYDPALVYMIVRDLLTYHFEIAYDMQINNTQYFAETINAQCIKVGKIKSIYEELAGERFVFEAPCRQNTPLCNELRAAENGRNHTHPVDLSPPTHQDANDYEASISLRQQCQKLGLSMTTGVVENVQQRCIIYRTRIADYFKGLKVAAEAKKRLDERVDAHAAEKKNIKTMTANMIMRQASDACHSMKIQHVLTLIKRGCNPNFQSNRGLTALLTAVLTQAPTELVEDLVKLKCNINAVNMFGITPLMMACRLKDTKMIHALMRLGCAALQDGGRAGQGLTAMHWCAIHGAEEESKIIIEYVREGGGDSLRMARVLDCQSENGDTPMMLAARIRNGLMCRVLSSLGANPNIRNAQNRNAEKIARAAGWTELADWLEKKVGAGVAKLETYSDLQYDKMVRYGKIRMVENIEEFGRIYLSLVFDSAMTIPLGPPSIARTAVDDVGKRAYDTQMSLANAHQYFIVRKDTGGRNVIINDPEKLALCTKLEELVSDSMLSAIKKGAAAPNTEAMAKPLAWTPLMCAACLNSVPLIKLLVRDGADPNHPNMHGTTALMQAAQLQNLEAMVELLILGADMEKYDNFGYTALAYATSLPIPEYMAKEVTYTIIDGDTEGPKKRDAAAILKIAKKTGLGGIKELIANDAEEASRVAVENHFRFMRLLENYGLSRLQTVKQMVTALNTADWRIGKDTHVKILAEEFSETASEQAERERVERARAEAAEHLEIEDSSVLRCPICTLTVPCAHFFKAETLKKFMEANTPEGVTSTGSAMQDMLNAAAMRKNFAQQNKDRARMKILTEVGIADRNTDRSIAFSKKYRARERELDRLAAARQAALEKKSRDAQEAEDEANRGEGWAEHTDTSGKVYYFHDNAHIRWDAIPDGQGQTYYHNPETNETLWDVPGLAEWIVQNNVAKAATLEAEKIEAEKKRLKEEKRAARDAKKVAKGKDNKTAIEIARDAAEEAKKAKKEADRKAEKEFSNKLKLKLLAAEAEAPIDFNSTADENVTVESNGFVTPVKKQISVENSIQTPKSILKKDGTNSKKEQRIRFVEGDIDPIAEQRKDWTALQNGTVEESVPISEQVVTTINTGNGPDSGEGSASEGEGEDAVVPLPGSPVSPTETRGEGLPLKGSEHYTDIVIGQGQAGKSSAGTEGSKASSDTASSDNKTLSGPPGVKVTDPDEERELTADEKFRMRKSNNPYPKEKRRLLSFTKEPLSAVDHLLQNEKKLTPKQLKEISRKNSIRSTVLSAIDAKHPEAPRSQSADLKRRSSAPKALLREPGKVQISGWVFVSISAPDLTPPVEKVELPLEMWSSMLEFVRDKFLTDWTQRLVLRSMVSPNSLKVTTPRCSACKIGFVRTKPTSEDQENSLCFSCIVRKVLYERAQQVFPRSFRRKARSQWPFRQQNELDDEEQLVPFGVPLTPLHEANNTIDPSSPIHSKRLAEIDIRETAFDLERNQQPFQLAIGMDEMSIDSTGSLTLPHMSLNINNEGKINSVTLGEGHNINLEQSIDSLPNSLSHLSIPSVFSNDTADAPDDSPSSKIPGELSLIAFMVAKGQFEEADRAVRVAVSQKSINEGEGAIFLMYAMALQADMYKLMGLYPLALGTYLECFDLIISILGFNATQSTTAMQWVSSCLLKMRCPALSKEWMNNVCRFLETEALSHNMYSQSKLLLDADREMRKKLVKNELIWKDKIVPVLAEREANPEWNHPSRNFRWILFKYCGYPAVYRLYANVDGYSVVARQAFEAHCKALDPNRLGKYARFVSMCFRLRTVNNVDVYRLIVQEMVQKYLALSIIETCEIAKVYRKITSEDNLKAVASFLQFGLPISVDVFDEILFHSIKVLGNSGEFRFFYLRDGGAGLRDRHPEDTVQCFNAIATKLQIPFRTKLARVRIRKIKEAREAERLRQLAEYNEAHGIKEETEEEKKQRKKDEKRAQKMKRKKELEDAGLVVGDDF